jgi:16S rRNA (adenine1518-N6/adenine1519-N6)-dimethyltransferase
MKMSEMKELLAARQIQLTKSLGQNFMHDANQLRRIIEAAELTPQDRVLEIGPGLGPLTELLLAGAGEVLAIEQDQRLVEVLRDRFAGKTNFTLENDDAVAYLTREARNWSGWKVVSNLPFSVASRIIVDLAWAEFRPERMVITLQYEVALRVRASAGNPHYGLLGLLMQLNYEPKGFYRLPAGSFFPRPEVDSACIVLRLRPNPPLDAIQEKAYRGLIKTGFSQRRKMMLKLLKGRWPEARLLEAFEKLKLSPQIRAEQVSRATFIELARLLAQVPSQPGPELEDAAENSQLP